MNKIWQINNKKISTEKNLNRSNLRLHCQWFFFIFYFSSKVKSIAVKTFYLRRQGKSRCRSCFTPLVRLFVGNTTLRILKLEEFSLFIIESWHIDMIYKCIYIYWRCAPPNFSKVFAPVWKLAVKVVENGIYEIFPWNNFCPSWHILMECWHNLSCNTTKHVIENGGSIHTGLENRGPK